MKRHKFYIARAIEYAKKDFMLLENRYQTSILFLNGFLMSQSDIEMI